ncbi:MAG TPA: hypothetical protein VEU08_17200 [Vicinamibacterales bacterium]|nr:hypothetical protein [Vicinamibacterales bacterium]
MPVTEEKRPETTAEPPAPANTAIAERPIEAPTPASTRAPVRMGLAPKTIEEAFRLAQYIASTELVPKQYQGKPNDVLVAIQYGMELGFPPMQALQSIAVINGRPSVWGDGFMALIIGSDPYREHDEYFLVNGDRREFLTAKDLQDDNTTAVSTFWRKDRQNPITGVFSVGQAKKAQLLGKQGPWSTYPDRMLKMRARGFAGRDGFADILRGIKSTEELLDTPVDELPQIPTKQPIEPRRASETRPATPSAESSPVAAAPPSAAPADSAAVPPSAKEPERREIKGLLVTHTCFTRPKSGEPYYEVKAKTTTGKEIKFLTRDESVYKEAASFESTDHKITAIVHDAKKETENVLVLDGLAIYEGSAAPAADNGLFTE